MILRPTNESARLPFLLTRTPYGSFAGLPDPVKALSFELAQSGYIFVIEDVRGRFQSEGSFEMLHPLVDHRSQQADESTDAYDTVAWLLTNVPSNNGRVGVLGTSYDGFLASMAGIDSHPAVKAISPQAPLIDAWLGDDFFHNGAFRQTYGYDYAIATENTKEVSPSDLDVDAYDFFLKAGSFAAVVKDAAKNLPTWAAFREHPTYDSFWQNRAVERHIQSWSVPTLIVGGWWDQEDMWGPQALYSALDRSNSASKKFLVLGPWNHGQWSRTTRKLGELDFGSLTGDQFREEMEAPFFAYYLKDEPGLHLTDTASFQSGTNRWMYYPHWPPRENIHSRPLYLGKETLSFTPPSGAEQTSYTAYTSDPAAPVPYRKRPIETTYASKGSGWATWLAQDQRFVADRKDVVAWRTPVLENDLTVTGEVIADLFASTSETDSDWIIKLIDVYPDRKDVGPIAGYQLMIAGEIFRGRYRQSFEQPQPIPANQILDYKFSLHGVDHVFLKGHSLMVQVQSSWFPLYDRNPQHYVQNIMTAKGSDYKAAMQKVYWSTNYPSHLELPIRE